jgi:hypothetical protein
MCLMSVHVMALFNGPTSVHLYIPLPQIVSKEFKEYSSTSKCDNTSNAMDNQRIIQSTKVIFSAMNHGCYT